MRKKTFFAVVVSMAFFLTGIPSLGQAMETPVNQNVTEVQDEMGGVSGYGYRSVKKTILNEQDLNVGHSKMSTSKLEEVPRAYDSREEGSVTAVKNQGSLGICWAYTAIGASESRILKKGLDTAPDLSEYHLSYSAYNKALDPLGLTAKDIMKVREMSNDIYDWGGNDYLAVSALARWQGEVDENVASMEELNALIAQGETAALSDDLMYEADSYHLQNAEFVYMSEANRDLIKRKLMQYGAATVSIHAPVSTAEEQKYGNTGKNNFTSYYCNNKYLETNHGVLIVVWDDDYAISNFNSKCRPQKPGAWLVRNSWGTNNEMGGYFWLSYEDALLQVENNEQAEVVFYDVEPADNYDYNYQYDGGMSTKYVCGYDYVANVYTAQGNEKLQAVSFYTQERNINYTISVYKMTDASDPTSGSKQGETLTGTVAERGYHTIDFTDAGGEDIYLSAGECFSVVLRLADSSDANVYYTIETTTGYSQMDEEVAAGAGESFVQNGAGWTDFTEVKGASGKKMNANFCIKAFTAALAENETIPTPTNMVTSLPVVTETPTATATSQPNVTVKPSSVSQVSTPLPTLSDRTPIVKKLVFRPLSKSVKAGKKLKLSKYLKITKNRTGSPGIVYEFTKKKYRKYATLSGSGVLKAKKAGRKKVLYVRARAKDGSGKSAKIRIKVK